MKKYLSSLLVLIAWAAFALPTRAQYLCQTTLPFQSGILQYNFSALGYNGNNFTAAALTLDDTAFGYVNFFLHSINGGATWTIQDPGLPDQNQEVNFIFTIDQIDSLNVIAIGDSGLVIHTSDGGATWLRQILPSNRNVVCVSFSSPTDGMIVVADTLDMTFVTSDGGNSWTKVLFVTPGISQCQDYGQGKYRLFIYYTGQTYTTTDNWQTVDSTGRIYTDSIQALYYGLGNCSFGDGDTIIAYGTHYLDLFSAATSFPLITRTTDGGEHWNTVYDDTVDFTDAVTTMSDIDRDTIVAGISADNRAVFNKILRSTDRGATWHIDTMIFHDSTFFLGADAYGIGLNTNGDLVEAIGQGSHFSSLILGQQSLAGVISEIPLSQRQIYPNPASETVNITSFFAEGTVHLLDILGREVLSGLVPASGPLTLDISHLPCGIYEVVVQRNNSMSSAGNLAILR